MPVLKNLIQLTAKRNNKTICFNPYQYEPSSNNLHLIIQNPITNIIIFKDELKKTLFFPKTRKRTKRRYIGF